MARRQAGSEEGALAAVKALAPRVFRPRRERIDEVRAVVAAQSRPSTAWRALSEAGLLPAGWIDDPRRRFGLRSLCGACEQGHEAAESVGQMLARVWDAAGASPPGKTIREEGSETASGEEERPESGALSGSMCLRCYRSPRSDRLRAHPRSRQACARLAADVDGVLRAEELAREAARRFAALGARVPDVIVWRTVDAGSWRSDVVGQDDTDWMDVSPLVDAENRIDSMLSGDGAADRRADQYDLLIAAADELSLLTGGNLPGVPVGGLCTMLHTVASGLAWAPPRKHARRADGPLLNPLEPMRELFATGYVLEAITPAALVLAEPGNQLRR